MSARALSLTLGAVFAAALATSLTFPPRARVYPLWVAVAGALLCLVAWLAADASEQPEGPAFREIRPYLIWVVALFGLIAVVGLPAGAALFVAVFLHREGKVGGGWAAVAGVASGCALLLLGAALGLRWPWALFDVAARLGLT